MTETVLVTGRDAAARHAPSRGPGAVFTKRWVVEMLLDLAGYRPERDLSALRALEPACGDGAFVAAMVERLVEACTRREVDVRDAVDAIAAYDVDPLAVRATRAVATRILVASGIPRRDAHRLCRQWVRQADFLLDPPAPASADIVVGNPPYVRLEDVPPDRMVAYRGAWPAMTGRADLYVGFVEAALRALRKDGVLAYICADRWMRNQYGGRLRELVTREFSVDATVVLHGVDAFDRRVAAYPAIAVIRRGAQGDALVVDTDSEFGERSARRVVEMARRPGRPLGAVDHARVSWSRGWFSGAASWPTGSPERLAMLARLENRFGTLEDDGTTRVGIGIATGADAVFVVPHDAPVEPDRLLPLAMARDTATGTLRWSGRHLVNPWTSDGDLVDLADHPAMGRYLRRHAAVLKQRHVARRGGAWWRTIDKVTPGLVSRPKLLLPDLKERLHPVLDKGGHYPHHNLFYVVSDAWDLDVLGGLLLSDVAQAFVEAYSVRMANGCLRVTAQYLRRIRVPSPADVPAEIATTLATAFRTRDREAATEAALSLYGLDEVPR